MTGHFPQAVIDPSRPIGNFPAMTSSEELRERYETDGYALVERAAPPEVTKNLLAIIHANMTRDPSMLKKFLSEPRVNVMPAYEFYGYNLPSVMAFHWGLTSRISDIAGKNLLPTYAFFRVYPKGDRCLVHTDRPSCEHSFTMSLDYGDDIVWPIEIGERFHEEREAADRPKADDFEGDAYKGIMLKPGDAIVYHGVNYRHGRTIPNPNRWSAHIFLHWVDAEGPFKGWAFDKKEFPTGTDFVFPDNNA